MQNACCICYNKCGQKENTPNLEYPGEFRIFLTRAQIMPRITGLTQPTFLVHMQGGFDSRRCCQRYNKAIDVMRFFLGGLRVGGVGHQIADKRLT